MINYVVEKFDANDRTFDVLDLLEEEIFDVRQFLKVIEGIDWDRMMNIENYFW